MTVHAQTHTLMCIPAPFRHLLHSRANCPRCPHLLPVWCLQCSGMASMQRTTALLVLCCVASITLLAVKYVRGGPALMEQYSKYCASAVLPRATRGKRSVEMSH